MKKLLVLTSALLCLTASLAAAQPTFLAWDDCNSGLQNKSSTCLSNTGLNTMVSSFIAPASFTGFASSTAELVIASNQAGLPLWWRIEAGTGCRPGALFQDDAGALGLAGCENVWVDALGVQQYDSNYNGNPARARFQGVAAMPVGVALTPGTQYIANAMSLRNTKTTGTGFCAGCAEPVCIVLTKQNIEQFGTPSLVEFITTPPNIPYVTWQGGAINDPAGCPLATPARKATWGSVKALYR